MNFKIFIKDIANNLVHEAQKIIWSENEISIWSNTWYGRHILDHRCCIERVEFVTDIDVATKKNINALQISESIIFCLKTAKTNIHANNFTKYVWFQFSTGRFLYNDQFVNYDYIESLISSKKLIFKKFDNHQGEKMAQYIVAE